MGSPCTGTACGTDQVDCAGLISIQMFWQKEHENHRMPFDSVYGERVGRASAHFGQVPDATGERGCANGVHAIPERRAPAAAALFRIEHRAATLVSVGPP
ncbi:MAG: hypothetical protein ABL993_06745 [Vicinamibacterales bacterium]